MQKWLDASSSSNKYRQMYIKGFLDISGGNLILRNNDLYVLNGDASFGHNLYVANNVTVGSKLIVQDLSINGRSNISFQNNSISPDAIIGGIPGTTGVFNMDVSINSNLFVNKKSIFNNDVTLNTRLFAPIIYENGFTLSQKYAPINSPTFTGSVTFPKDVSGLDASMVGLNNVNNTSDANKPVSTATATALALKSNITDASFLGIPRAPTANAGTNTNQIATTQFVNTGINAVVGNPPATLNTLQSLAQALTNDPSFGTNLTNTVNTSLQAKAPVDRPSFLTYVMAPKLLISSDSSFNGKLFVSGDVSMNGNVKANTFYEGGSSLIAKYATLSAPTFTNRVVSTGDISANSRLFLSGDASFGGNVYVSNDLSMNGRLLVSKSAYFAGDVSLNNRLSVGGDVSFNGNLAIQNQLQVNSNAVFGTDVSMNNNVDISGAIIAHNNMNIYGVINQQAINIYDGYFTSFDNQLITDVSSIKNIVNIATGATNTIVGKSAGVTSGTNSTVIGNGATPSSGSVSNEITLGNSSISVLRCAATAITSVSDERDKTNIEDLTVGMDFIKELRPVKFDWAMRDGGKVGEPDFGFIAQDLLSAQEKVGENVPNLVITENPERLEASYAKLIPVLVKSIQELQSSLDTVKTELNLLKMRN
jgi:hypothetical protein